MNSISSLTSVTRLHVRNARHLLPFFGYIVDIRRQAMRAPGFLGGKLLYEPGLTFWTMTAWTDETAMRAFQIAGAHGAAMPKLLDWCDEASVVHWTEPGTSLPDWHSAHRRMVVEGRLSKVSHPSPVQLAGHITRPRWSPFEIPLKPKQRDSMKAQLASATKIINASAEEVYKIVADYRAGHPLILPKEDFLSLEVEQGGFGEGTIVNFKMKILGRTQSFRSLITEPEPGRRLVETDIRSETPTTFLVVPVEDGLRARVTISTELKDRNPVEGFIAKIMLQKIYRKELDLLANLAEDRAALAQSAAGTRSA